MNATEIFAELPSLGAERERLVAEAKKLYYEGLRKAGLEGGERK